MQSRAALEHGNDDNWKYAKKLKEEEGTEVFRERKKF